MVELYQYIGEKIRELRIRHQLSQEAFAKKIRVASNTVSRWETGTYKPTPEDLDKIAREFAISITAFFPDIEPEQKRIAMLASATADLDPADLEEVVRYAEYRKARRAMTALKKRPSSSANIVKVHDE